MKVGKCTNSDCIAPINCHEGEEDYKTCQYWIANNSKEVKRKEKVTSRINNSNVSWSGDPFKVEDVAKIHARGVPIYIGIVGKADAGKTTFLAMLYTLLLRGGQFDGYKFAGTKTILGWEELYHKLKVFKNQVSFPDPTPFEYYRLLHYALKDENGLLRDILLSDASGEVFSLWAQNRNDASAENARKIYSTSSAFVLFIDCVDLIDRMNIAKTEIVDIAQMLISDLRERPVIVVWSKAERKKEVNHIIRESLKEEMNDLFKNYIEIDISNFSEDDPDCKVHVNNLKVIDLVLSEVDKINKGAIVSVKNDYEDLFLNYKGK
ncbi:TRAFAC clade GTPase domain-containing protein [Rufibacter latericius]|uniref:Double-GTPase 2 domain-containing protein n=1 Tax=Rufibacter latericius TaxID=2487040 RepID=A0A3M9MCT0_9BACT|nr:hypothetical protein [Rufibacter latericius]RNI23371.1 hypothetical protein EFB08_17640 [Rufibacter latericius]